MSAGGVSVTSRTGTAEAAAGGQLDDVKMSKMGMSQAMDDSELDEPVRQGARARAREPARERATPRRGARALARARCRRSPSPTPSARRAISRARLLTLTLAATPRATARARARARLAGFAVRAHVHAALRQDVVPREAAADLAVVDALLHHRRLLAAALDQGPRHRDDQRRRRDPQGEDALGARRDGARLRVQQGDRHVPEPPALLHRRLHVLRPVRAHRAAALEPDVRHLQHRGRPDAAARLGLVLRDRVVRLDRRLALLGLRQHGVRPREREEGVRPHGRVRADRLDRGPDARHAGGRARRAVPVHAARAAWG